MKKTYCDVCKEKCDDLGPGDRLDFTYPTGEDDTKELNLEDICWDCRKEIANAIKTIIAEKKKA